MYKRQPKYLFFYEKGADAKEAFKTALGDTPITDNGQTVTVDDVTFGCSTNTTQLTVRNTYNRLTAKKYWLSAADGRPLAEADIPVKSIQVELYRYTEGQTAQDAVLMDTQYLNKDNGWSFTWSGENQIPAADINGKKYCYFVKEVTTGNWVTEITNSIGIQTGKIFITNRVYSGYVLPSTGGMGTTLFYVLGGGLMLGAIFMATDYATSPVTKPGQLIFGLGCGLLTCFIRRFGSYPEGVCYSILIMNCTTWLLDKYIRPVIYGAPKKEKKEAAK